jgi:hypothetical protein
MKLYICHLELFFRPLINYVIYHNYRQIMNKNTSVMAAALAVAGILTLAVMTMPLQHHAFGQQLVRCPNGEIVNAPEECQIVSCDPPSTGVKESTANANEWNSLKQSTGGEGSTHAIGGGGECMSGGAGGAGGEGGLGGTNFIKDTDRNADVDQDANGGKSNGGYGGNANGGSGSIR